MTSCTLTRVSTSIVPRPASNELTRRLGDKLVVEWIPVKTRGALAAHISNIAMGFAIKAVAEWLSCGFDEELAVLAALMKGADLSDEIV
jgi:hypothetical protein